MEEKGEEADSLAIPASLSAQASYSGKDPAVSDSDPGQDPPHSETHIEVLEFFRQEAEEKEEKDEEEEKEDAEAFREAKRRKKNCPAALEKSLSSNRGFSFSFDTKVAPIESTPKFGSFNLGLGGSDFDGVSLRLGLGLGFPEEQKKGGAVGEEEEGLKPGEEE